MLHKLDLLHYGASFSAGMPALWQAICACSTASALQSLDVCAKSKQYLLQFKLSQLSTVMQHVRSVLLPQEAPVMIAGKHKLFFSFCSVCGV